MIRISNGWTGGQYSLYRVLLGGYLFVHFATLIPWGAELFSNRGAVRSAAASPLAFLFPNLLVWADSPVMVTALLIAATATSLVLAAGKWDRAAALGLWYVLACLFGRNPLIANPALPFVGWLLLAHAILPAAPIGSIAARGRVDPGNGWELSPRLYAAAWIVMASAYSYSGITKLVSPSWVDGTALARILDNPLARPGFLREMLVAWPTPLLAAATWASLALELSFAPLALFARMRPWLWAAMVAMHLGLVLTIDFADLTAGMLMLHLFTFDPAWVGPRRAGGTETETVFYDGHCGLCHGMVRFLLAEDGGSARFRFATLGGETFSDLVPASERERLPDSLVVRASDGALLVKARAVLYVLRRLGGLWRVGAALLALLPSRLLDAAYDGVGRIRYRFGRTSEACPIVPAHLRGRFLG